MNGIFESKTEPDRIHIIMLLGGVSWLILTK